MARSSTPFVGLGRTGRDVAFTPYNRSLTRFSDSGETTGNVNPTSATVTDATMPTQEDAGQQTARPEEFLPSAGSNGGMGGAPQAPGRDLAVNPLSPTEIAALSGIASVAPAPVGMAIGYNYGNQTGNVLSGAPVSSTIGANQLAGMSVPQSISSTLFHMTEPLSFLPTLGSTVVAAPANPMQQDPAQQQGQTAENAGSENNLGNGVGGFGVGVGTGIGVGGTPGMSMGGPNGGGTGPTSGNGPAGGDTGGAPAGGDTGGPSPGASMGGPNGGGSGPTGGNSDSDGGGPGWADGGIVGLSAPRYADGGLLGGATTAPQGQSLATMGFASGGSVPLGAAGGPGVGQAEVEGKIAMMLKNPQLVQKLQSIVAPAMQNGQLTPQELQMLGQIATACMANPALYPRLRQFATSNGVTNLPPAYDQKVIITLIAVSKVMGGQQGGQPQPGAQGATPPGQVPPTSQAQMVNPNGQPDGGMLMGPGTGRSDSIGTQNMSTGGPVKVSNGEYVIPAHVVKAKGQEFFDNLLRRYADLGNGSQGEA